MEPFITVADLGAYIRRDLTDNQLAEDAVAGACDTLREEAEQTITAVFADIVTLDGPGTDALLLPDLPVVEVIDVYDNASETSIDPSTYWVDNRRGVIYTRARGSRWLPGRGLYTVAYSHGYAYPGQTFGSGSGDISAFRTLPAWLKILAVTVAARYYDQGLVKQESVGGYQSIYASDETVGLTKRERDQLIAKLRRGR